MGPFEIRSISSTPTIGKRTDHYITKNSLHLPHIRPLFNNDPIGLPMQTVFTDADSLPLFRRWRNTQKDHNATLTTTWNAKPNPPKPPSLSLCLEHGRNVFSRGNTKRESVRNVTRGVRNCPAVWLGVCKPCSNSVMVPRGGDNYADDEYINIFLCIL